MSVVQFPLYRADESTVPIAGESAPAASTNLLSATLAFERLVDSLLAFQQLRGALPKSGDPSPAVRATMRDALVGLLNELDAPVRAAAETRCAAFLNRALPILTETEREVVRALVADGLEDYRRGLRLVPLRGIGALR